MDNSIKIIDVSDLKEGMIIAGDVSDNDHILLRKGFPVTTANIQKLHDTLFFGKIKIFDEENKEQLKIARKKKAEYTQVENEFNEISSRLQRTFRLINNDQGSSLNELKEFSTRIQNELQPSSIVIKNIVLQGSGTDSIYRHGVNVAALSALIGKWVGIDQKDLNNLTYAALLHDFGKVKISKDILNKVTTLTNSEFNLIKTHSNLGYKLLKDISYLDKSVLYGVLMHHEREDGSGYPLGLKSEAIHPFAKIIAIADVFDAINSNRGYKRKKPPFEALQIVKNESLGQLNYEYSKIFIQHIVNYYLGEEVILNNKKRCKIIQMNTNDLEKPLVLIEDEFVDLTKEPDLYIEELVL